MGSSAVLHIGPKSISHKYESPEVWSLLFESEDYVSINHESEGWREHKFVSTCGKAIDRLSKHNITLVTLRRLYLLYHKFNLERYRNFLLGRCDVYLKAKYGKPVDYKIVERMANHIIGLYFEQLSDKEEHERMMKCFRDWVLESDEPKRPSSLEPTSSLQMTLEFDKEEYFKHLLVDFIRQDPYSLFIDDDWLVTSGLTDFDDLFFDVTPIFASDPELSLELDITEFVDSGDGLISEEAATILAKDRINLMLRSQEANKVFGQISGSLLMEENSQVVLPKAAEVVAIAERITVIVGEPPTAKEKGDFLEDLSNRLFEEQEGFEVKQKVRGRNDELDLVIKNKIDDPFWHSMNSPFILVECKNWKDKVEAKHIRDFEMKIHIRRALCRLGVFIALGGFTSGCIELASSAGREGIKILLVNNAALKKRTGENLTTVEWLEKLMLEQF